MNKRHYDSEETIKIIAEKAAQIFSQKGYAATSIVDISKASGFSKGHIYYHFQNKEKLFIFLAQDTMRNWAEKWHSQVAAYSTAEAKLYAMAHFVLNNYKTPLLKVGQELARNPATSPETVQQLMGLAVTPMQAYAAIFKEGIESKEFIETDVEQTSLLFSSWMGALCQYIFTMDYDQLKQLFQQAVTIFLGGIRKA